MKALSLPETAYQILANSKEPLKFSELYAQLAKELEMSEEEKAAHIGQLYTDISLDGRFVALTDNYWDLRSRHTYDKVHIDVNCVYSDVDEGEIDAEDAKEDAEYNAAMEGKEVSGEEGDEDVVSEGEEASKNKESKEAAELVGMGGDTNDY